MNERKTKTSHLKSRGRILYRWDAYDGEQLVGYSDYKYESEAEAKAAGDAYKAPETTDPLAAQAVGLGAAAEAGDLG